MKGRFTISFIACILILSVSFPAENAFAFTEKKITASDADIDDRFGLPLAISGNTAIVGAQRNDDDGSNSGSAYIFEKDEGGAGNWGEVTILTASDAAAGDEFGTSVAISGNTAVVGANFNNAIAGSAYIFERNQGGAGNWGEVKIITGSNSVAGDSFGISVAISGDTIVVGASFDDVIGDNSGSVFIFERNQGGAGNWGEVKKITASDAADTDFFGTSAAISGDIVIIGAPLNDVNVADDDAGAAYIFERNQGGAGNWGEITKITTSDAAAGDHFGNSVAISGSTAVAGAPLNDDDGSDSGSAYIFEKDEGGAGNWGEVKKIHGSNIGLFSNFGISVGISGDTVIAGLPNRNAGLAFIFERDEGGVDNWGEVTPITSSDGVTGDNFGGSVSISGKLAMVGGWGNDDDGSESGSAYIFDLDSNGPDLDGDGTPDSSDPINVITSDTTLTTNHTVIGNVIVQDNVVLTIPDGLTLSIPSGSNITILLGGGVLIEFGGTLQVHS